MERLFPFFILLLGASAIANPQTSSKVAAAQTHCEIWGQIAGSTRLLREGLDIELIGQGSTKQKVPVRTDGNFDFNLVATGRYEFRVTDRSGAVLLDKVKSIDDRNTFVFLMIRDPATDSVARNTVSFASLEHKTPRRALDAYKAAQTAAGAGDTANSIRHLEEAVTMDPAFADAHSDLAAILAQTGRIEEGLQHAQTAFELNPQLPEASCNFALLLVSLRHYPEAEAVARRTLAGQYCLPILHGVLSVSLVEQRKNIDEALEHLQFAVAEFPFFRLLAARAMIEGRRPDLALIQVKAYLKSGAHDCERPALEAWVKSVESRVISDQ